MCAGTQKVVPLHSKRNNKDNKKYKGKKIMLLISIIYALIFGSVTNVSVVNNNVKMSL